MKLSYCRDTESLCIDLSSKAIAESRDISDGIVLDYDSDGNLVGIDIDNASRKIMKRFRPEENSFSESVGRALCRAAKKARIEVSSTALSR